MRYLNFHLANGIRLRFPQTGGSETFKRIRTFFEELWGLPDAQEVFRKYGVAVDYDDEVFPSLTIKPIGDPSFPKNKEEKTVSCFDLTLTVSDGKVKSACLGLSPRRCEVAKWLFEDGGPDETFCSLEVVDMKGIVFLLTTDSLEVYQAKAIELRTAIGAELERLQPLMRDYRRIRRLEALMPVSMAS